MEQTQESTQKTYQIGGRVFTAPPIVARQEKWLWPILKPFFVKSGQLTDDDIVSLLGESLTRVAAIILVPEGQTQAEKVRAGWAGVEALEAWMDESVTVAALAPVFSDFFSSGQPWTLLIALAKLVPPGPTTGSTTPSAPLPTATSSKPSGSGPTSGSATPAGISSDSGSAAVPSAPSLVSAG